MARKTRLITALNIGTALAAFASAPALAQVDPEDTAAEVNEAVDDTAGTQTDTSEIVVTARRREENLQDVPIAVTAYSGEALEAQGAIDITDLSDTTPNVTLENTRGTNNSLSAFIRGVGQQDPVGGFEAGVGIYLDDVFLNRPQAAVLDIYDVERIEILRGPQGTLYGRNTIGGAVKYVTRRLPDDPELKFRGTIGTYSQADAIVSASAPVYDFMKVGASFARLSRGGFGDNIFLDDVENYNKDVWAGRLSMEFESPDDRLFVRIAGDYTKDNSDPRNGHRLITSLLTGAPVLEDVFDTRAGLANPEQEVEAYGLSLNISAELTEALTFRSISGWRKDTSFTPIDFDALPGEDVDVPARYANEQLSQEFQLLYEGDRLQGLVGFYYLDAEAQTTFDVILNTTAPLLGLPALNAATDGEVLTDTWSVFGDFTFDITDQLSVSAGGRFTHDERTASILRQNKIGRSAIFGGTPINLGPAQTNFEGDATFEEFTPRASISYKPNEDHTIYASYSKGFKGGGFDPRGNATIAPDTDGDGVREFDEIYDFFLFEPETVDSYELGWKASMFDRRLRFALTGFYADYQDVQIPGSVGVDANGDGIFESFAGVTTNAAKAEFKGIELETFARIAPNFAGPGSSLNFTGTLGYVDAKYKEFLVGVANFDENGNPAPGTQGLVDIADFRRIQNTPKWTLSGTLDATVGLAIGSLTGSTTVSYRSKTFQFETPSPFLDQPGYALWDASLVWTSNDDRYSLGLHAKNITDKEYITSGYQFLNINPVTGAPVLSVSPVSPVFGQPGIAPSLGREGVVTVFYGNPRQVYLTAGLKF
jgi:iron complex outermembrane recepter protein